MMRKSLFMGLTGALVVVLVYLVFRGRHQERQEQQIHRPIEIVRDSKPSPTRILAPQDLEIVEIKTALAGDAAKTARHNLVIRNNGVTTYHSALVRLSYLGPGNRTLETKIWEAKEILQPGQARSFGEIVMAELPAETLRAKAGIIAADVESPSSKVK